MDYIFGIVDRNGVTVENLKTVGDAHTDLAGFVEVVREYPDSTIIDHFKVVEKYHSGEDAEGNAYDWYIIGDHYRYEDRFTPNAETLRRGAEASEIAFVVLAEAGSIDAITAGEHTDIFLPWQSGIAYAAGNLRQHGGKLYKCIQAHTSQEGWEPDKTASLWTLTHDPAEEWPSWSAPIGAQDAYQQGAKVTHSEKHWTSDLDNNVWEPGVYGWTEAQDE